MGDSYHDFARVIGDSTVPKTTVDDFEDGDMSEYRFVSSNGSSDVVSGEIDGLAFKISGPASGDREEYSLPGDGLSAYIDQGDTHIVDIKLDSVKSQWIYGIPASNPTGSQGVLQGYAVLLDYDNQRVSISLRDDSAGNYIGLNSTSAPIDTGVVYRCKVEWTSSGDHNITVSKRSSGDTVATVSATDTTYGGTDLGHGFRSDGGTQYYDNIQIL